MPVIDRIRGRIRTIIAGSLTALGAALTIWGGIEALGRIDAALDSRIAGVVSASIDSALEEKLGPALEAELPAIVTAATSRFMVCDEMRRQRAFAADLVNKDGASAAEIAEAEGLLETLTNTGALLGCEAPPG
jgi:hypothetical protein